MSKAVAVAPALSAEVRLVQALSEFATLLPEKQRVVFKSLQRASPPGPGDVIRVTEEINRDGAQQHRVWQHQGTRLVGILDKVLLFSKVGDIMVGGSQNMIACSVWAVVKLSLQVAVGYLTFFEKVSMFFMHIGKASATQRDLALLFPDCEELQTSMCEYLIILVEACARVIQYTRKGSLGILSASIFTSFEKDFTDIETRLQKWSNLINQRVLFLSTKANSQNHALLLRSSTQSSKRQEEAKYLRALHRLSPNQADFDLIWRKERKRGAVAWIFQEDDFNAWKSSKKSAVMWVTGSIGSGKTVVLANIIGDVHFDEGTQRVALFFCNHSNRHSLKATNIVASIAYQLIRPIVIGESDLTVEQRDALNSIRREDTEGMIEGLTRFLPRTTEIYVVLDALDECALNEASEVLEAVQSLLTAFVTRVCLSSRKDSDVVAMASSHFVIQHNITMANPRKMKEMAEYIDAEISRRNRSGVIDGDIQALIRDTLTEKANGMYLWVALQIEALFPRYTERLISDLDIFRTLEMLPKDLPEAFSRALEGVRDERYGRTIFELVAVARRPLTAGELRIALNVEPGVAEWNSATLPYNAQILVALCSGGLLEIEEEREIVQYIHFSALQYLMEPPNLMRYASKYHVDLDKADMKLGSICVTYLSYADFETELVTKHAAMVDVTNLTSKIVTSILPQTTMAGRFLANSLSNLWEGEQKQVNIGSAIEDYLRRRQKKDDIRGLLSFARQHWLDHTQLLFLEPTTPSWHLFRKLVFGAQTHVVKPWKNSLEIDGLEWSLRGSHGSLIYLITSDGHDKRSICSGIIQFINTQPPHLTLHPNILGRVLEYLVENIIPPQHVLTVLVNGGARLQESSPDRGSKSALNSMIKALSDTQSLSRESLNSVSLLLCAGAAPLPGLTAAVEAGWYSGVETLLKASHPVSQELLSDFLSTAVRKSDLEIAKSLIVAGAQLNATPQNEESLMQLAMRTGNPEMMLFLINQGAPLEAFGTVETHPLIQMIQKGLFDVADAFLEKVSKAPPPVILKASVHAIAKTRTKLSCANLIQRLIDSGAEIDERLEGGLYTPLAEAIIRNNVSVVRCLLQKGASPDISFGSNSAPSLALACQKCFREIADVLIAHGVDVNAKGTDGLTALHYAVAARDATTVKALLEASADPNVVSFIGVRAINQAVDMADEKIISLLLEYGAKLDSIPSLGDVVSHPLLRACSLMGEFLHQKSTSGSAKRLRVIRQLLDKYETTRGLEAAYQLVSRQLDNETTLYFVQKGLDLHSPSFSASPEHHPLVEVVRRGIGEVVRSMAEQSPADIQGHALWAAIIYTPQNLQKAIVECLLSTGADPRCAAPEWCGHRRETLLSTALERAGDEIILTLSKAGAAFDIGSFVESENPVLLAARYGRQQAFVAIWEAYIVGSGYEVIMSDLVRNIIGPLGSLTEAERRHIIATMPKEADIEGKEFILAYLESCMY